MSAANFYQTFYQSEQLFRLADDVWVRPERREAAPPAPRDTDTLLAELDALLTERTAASVEVLPAEPLIEPTAVAGTSELVVVPGEPPVAEPELWPVPIVPEPLPRSVPRSSVPSVLPPSPQAGRLPQLNHKVLLLADEQLDPSNLLFLEKILRAVNLNVDGVDLLNLNGVQDVDFAELLRGKYIHHFITFGVPFERINLDIMMDRYAPVRFEGITFLIADSLPTIEADQALKRRLWAALQRVFLQRYT